MTLAAPIVQGFFTQRLAQQRVSANTVTAYRDCLRLLLRFAQDRTGQAARPTLDLADLDAELVGAFLDHLEADRHNGIETRNLRLAAIHSLFRYAQLRCPEHAEVIARVLAIPAKRPDTPSSATSPQPRPPRCSPPRTVPSRSDDATTPHPGRRPDRAAGLRAHRAELRRHHLRCRRQRLHQRQRTTRTPHPPHPGHRQAAASLDQTTAAPARRPRLRHPRPEDASAPTPSRTSSTNTSPPQPPPARPCAASG